MASPAAPPNETVSLNVTSPAEIIRHGTQQGLRRSSRQKYACNSASKCCGAALRRDQVHAFEHETAFRSGVYEDISFLSLWELPALSECGLHRYSKGPCPFREAPSLYMRRIQEMSSRQAQDRRAVRPRRCSRFPCPSLRCRELAQTALSKRCPSIRLLPGFAACAPGAD